MPSRKRHRSTPPVTSATPAEPPAGRRVAAPGVGGAGDAVERFAAALKESERRDRAERERKAKEKAEADRRAAERTAHADAVRAARRDLDRAIDAVRTSTVSGRGRAEADAAWRVAKARVLELETGERPTWAPAPGVAGEPGAEQGSELGSADGSDDGASTTE